MWAFWKLQHISPSCRRFTRNELPWKRSWSSYVRSLSCDLPHLCAVSRAERTSWQSLKEGSTMRLSSVSVVVGRAGLSGLPSPHCTHLPLEVKKVQKTNIWLLGISKQGDSSPSFLPLPSLICKSSLSLKWVTWEYFIYVKNSWFILILPLLPQSLRGTAFLNSCLNLKLILWDGLLDVTDSCRIVS